MLSRYQYLPQRKFQNQEKAGTWFKDEECSDSLYCTVKDMRIVALPTFRRLITIRRL